MLFKNNKNAKKNSEDVKDTLLTENIVVKIIPNDEMGISEKYNRQFYDDTKAKRLAKKEAFNEGDVFDPYTDAKLAPDKTTAKELFGNSENSAQTDHILPLENIHEAAKKNPFLKDKDIKEIANNSTNLKVLSQKSNQSKTNKTPSEYIEYMQKEKETDIDKVTQRKIKMEERRAKTSVNVGLVTHTAKNIGAEAFTGAISAVESSAIPLALTMLGNIVQVCDGKKNAKQATLDISKSVGAVATTGAATKLLKTAFNNLDNPTLQTLLENNLPAQIISVAMLIKDDVTGLKTKQISPQTATSNMLTKFTSLMGGKVVSKAASEVLPKILVKFGGANVVGTVAAVYIDECAKNLFDEVVGHGAWEAIKNSSYDCKETAKELLEIVNKFKSDIIAIDECINQTILQQKATTENLAEIDKIIEGLK